eukprot:TRINITY_DN11375_c0_g1_i2.p1 TRINITY_DN11375_c0_g1~~TRINITY_DN11375_c0_g1_i2.p1  ORF type:complete len:202 (+),score=59.54 TRINITY_DN11375_c0_g1_i2:169-774(+)
MRCILQRCLEAAVAVDGKVVSQIGPGLLVLVGIVDGDTEKGMDYVIKKTLHLKLWPAEDGKPWTRSCVDMGYDVLVVSQFTLPICFKKGSLTSNNANRPDFHFSMPPKDAEPMYDRMLEQYRTEYAPEKVQAGVFGAMMEVSLSNDGPVTIQLDSAQPRGVYDVCSTEDLAEARARAAEAEKKVEALEAQLQILAAAPPEL